MQTHQRRLHSPTKVNMDELFSGLPLTWGYYIEAAKSSGNYGKRAVQICYQGEFAAR